MLYYNNLSKSITQVDGFKIVLNNRIYNIINNTGPGGTNVYSAAIGPSKDGKSFQFYSVINDKFYMNIPVNSTFIIDEKNYYICKEDSRIQIFPTMCKKINK